MTVINTLCVTLKVPELEPGIKFYTDAGLIASVEGSIARFRCAGQSSDAIVLLGGAPRKQLHHVAFRATGLDEIARRVPIWGGRTAEPPSGFQGEGLWVEDPHGVLIRLVDVPAEPEPMTPQAFEINEPGRIVRKGRSAMMSVSKSVAVRPRRIGHVLLFTPDVLKSVQFATKALGLGLSDRAQDIVAFCCARKKSDHHIFAFAKSPGTGFHHASFQVSDPDEVGRGGRMLVDKAGRGDWGFGRHTIGSNFFHYIQDPWGSWFEYFADIDHIEDYTSWNPTNYGLEDAMANWGPAVTHDFIHNYEIDERPFEAGRR